MTDCDPGQPYAGSAAPLIPPDPTLGSLREAAAGCQACHLWRCGTQTVFGDGAADARIMLVGEAPGDQEDRAGRPFVGPAGRLLDQALAEAGIDRAAVYITNTVKHFKHSVRGRRRVAEKPNAAEVAACRPWLEAEIALLRPEAIVCLGAVAAQALLGKEFRVTRQRGQLVPSLHAPRVLATLHPSAILRIPDPDQRASSLAQLAADLRLAAG